MAECVTSIKFNLTQLELTHHLICTKHNFEVVFPVKKEKKKEHKTIIFLYLPKVRQSQFIRDVEQNWNKNNGIKADESNERFPNP